MGDQQDYSKLAEEARERRRILESRRKELERHLRESESMPVEARPSDRIPDTATQLESPWIEEHEVVIEEPPHQQNIQPLPQTKGGYQGLRRNPRRRGFRLTNQSDLRNAILAQEILGPPKGLQSF